MTHLSWDEAKPGVLEQPLRRTEPGRQTECCRVDKTLENLK